MNEETKQVEMYAYIVNGKKLWTSNLVFAQMRAKYYGDDRVYVEVVTLED